VSMLYTFCDSNAKDRHLTQYFEMYCNRAIYNDGWLAGTVHGAPWETEKYRATLENDKWELYDTRTDFSLADDLADRNPQKLNEMKELFKQEAVNMKKNFFNDVKASYPKMKSEIKEMGNIRENEMMRVGLQDTNGMIKSTKMMRSLKIGRGDMRPEAVGIMDYDFSIDPIRSKKKKIQLYDEDDFINREE